MGVHCLGLLLARSDCCIQHQVCFWTPPEKRWSNWRNRHSKIHQKSSKSSSNKLGSTPTLQSQISASPKAQAPILSDCQDFQVKTILFSWWGYLVMRPWQEKSVKWNQKFKIQTFKRPPFQKTWLGPFQRFLNWFWAIDLNRAACSIQASLFKSWCGNKPQILQVSLNQNTSFQTKMISNRPSDH